MYFSCYTKQKGLSFISSVPLLGVGEWKGHHLLIQSDLMSSSYLLAHVLLSPFFFFLPSDPNNHYNGLALCISHVLTDWVALKVRHFELATLASQSTYTVLCLNHDHSITLQFLNK